jgi:hypothetical protein
MPGVRQVPRSQSRTGEIAWDQVSLVWVSTPAVPIISVFFGIVVRMFYKEHEPAHFHAEYQGQRGSSTSMGTRSREMSRGRMTTIPAVIRAEYRGDYRIRLTFNDNQEKTIDFRQWLDGPVFELLKDPACFKRFFLDGGTVVWPNGADIAPETLFAHEGVAEEAA